MRNDGLKRSVNGDDIFNVRWVDAPCLSADGQHLAYTVTYLDREGDAMRTKIHCSQWEHAGHSPRWSPNSSALAFIHDDANGIAQVWLWHRHTQAVAPISHLPQACSWPTWSPDGAWLAFLSNSQLWVFDVENETSTALTFFYEAIATPCWLPDSRHIVFTSSRQMGSETQLWLCQVNHPPPASPTLLYTNLGPIRALASAPSGKALVWIGHERGLAQGVNFGVWQFELASQTAQPLTATFDRSAGLTTRSDDVRGMNPPDLVWLRQHDQDRVYFAYAEGGASHIGWVGLDGTVRPIITGERSCLAFSIAPATGSLAAVIATATDPGEVIATDLDGNGEHALTQVNAAWLNEVQLSQHQAMHFVASDGVTVEAWFFFSPSSPPSSFSPASLLHAFIL
ncbi:MAG: DPP IV N-terminal domain-containing protein, partial [Anaerolineae bacterium]|nr:DPP IV N-terminal domain-containing protein [Anaerolineae bacterium]